jgi:hypothetical protein
VIYVTTEKLHDDDVEFGKVAGPEYLAHALDRLEPRIDLRLLPLRFLKLA